MSPAFIVTEAHGLRLDLHLIEPDHAAWHLRISDAQLVSCSVLPLDAGPQDMHRAILRHLGRKVELAKVN